jgi:ABC-type transporter Mla subunit MlaD
MASKVPTPKEIMAAAQAAAETAQTAAREAAETAQTAAGAALRIPPASIQLASQLPDLIENLAIATERLNTAIDRAERYLALADPMIRTMDAVLPQLEALVKTGNEVYGAVSGLPGVATLSRLASRGSPPAEEKPSRGRATPKKK